jgi:hypothetical protein
MQHLDQPRNVGAPKDPKLPPGCILVSQFIPQTDSFKSQYGRITGIAWLNEEAMRLNRAGIATQIIRDEKHPELVALVRKERI